MPDPTLPARDPAAENAFVAAWSADPDPGVLPDVVGAALDARRPRLAARLVNLLDDGVVDGDPNLERARRAARLLLLEGPSSDAALAEFSAAWESARGAWMARARARHRQNSGPGIPVLGVSPTPTARRKPRRR